MITWHVYGHSTAFIEGNGKTLFYFDSVEPDPMGIS